ncbi:sugar kinase [Microbacterium sp. A196]|uniref:sugar kinase n=1 Tax=Microbacterium sp. A196 TaxID=3457320 RepID=UPI003FD1F4A5
MRAGSAGDDYDVVTVGESLGVFGTLEAGRLGSGREFVFRVAGAESNFAIAVQRLGLKAQWVSVLGNDDVGQAIRRELRAEGVAVKAAIDLEAATASMIKVHRSVHSMTATYFRSNSAFATATRERFDVDDVRRARCLHFSGISIAVSPGATEAIDAAIDEAREGGAMVSMDVNHRRAIWSDDETAGVHLRAFASRCDVLFASPEEAALIVGPGTPEQQAEALNDLGIETVAIKLGSQGALCRQDGRVEFRPALDVTVVDAVGAGDAFAGGFIAAYLRDADIGTALEYGNTVAAFAITARGDWENLPTPDEFDLIRCTDMVR